MNALRLQLDGLAAQLISSSGPSPSSRRSRSNQSSSAKSVAPGSTLSNHSIHSSSASSSTGSSQALLPKHKKSRPITDTMDVASDDDSHLPPILHQSPAHALLQVPPSEPVFQENSDFEFEASDSEHLPPVPDATLPDPNTQYNANSESDGGAPI